MLNNNNNSNNFKTLSEILKEASNDEEILVLNLPNSLYNSCIAMTKFAEYLESLAKDEKVSFRIITTEVCRVKMLNCDKIIPVLGNWCSTFLKCEFNGHIYYFELGDNPFFDDHYYMCTLLNDKGIEKYKRHVYMDVWRVNKNYVYELGRYDELLQSMIREFPKLTVSKTEFKERPYYECIKKQTIYKIKSK